MKLHRLPKLLEYFKSTKRRGKGVGSGQGKTAGRGHKGGKARAGYSPAQCCSGVPFYRHLPIRGFSNSKFRKKYVTISLKRLADLQVDMINKADMKKLRLIKSSGLKIKVLGGCTLSEPIIVVADEFSKGAAGEIFRSGGQAICHMNIIEGQKK
jgi:large subunit ribosomal protein L15